MAETNIADQNVEPAGIAPVVPAGEIEIGWILAGRFDEPDRRAIRAARERVLSFLQARFPQFGWRMPLVSRPELVKELRVEPTDLLDDAVRHRNRRRWDFSVIVTSADLRGQEQSTASFALSRTLESAVISTSQLDPRAWNEESEPAQRTEAMTLRIAALVLHAIGHWSGLGHVEQRDNIMHPCSDLSQLDRAGAWTEAQIREAAESLAEIADRRLEERGDAARQWRAAFVLRALWLNRADLGRAVWEARPWQFPFRLNRLTAAATSAGLVMLMTAEVWDLAMNLSGWLVTGLSSLVIAATTFYILKRQRLIVRRPRGELSEQIVLSNAATACIVLLGMASTYAMLYLFSFVLSVGLFTGRLATGWAASLQSPLTTWHYAALAGFIAALGITIGALGASFEQQSYFRHVTFVDEEL